MVPGMGSGEPANDNRRDRKISRNAITVRPGGANPQAAAAEKGEHENCRYHTGTALVDRARAVPLGGHAASAEARGPREWRKPPVRLLSRATYHKTTITHEAGRASGFRHFNLKRKGNQHHGANHALL